MPAEAAIGGGALIGLIGGAQSDKSSSSSQSGINLGAESELEKYGGSLTNSNLKALEQMVKAGPGQSAIGEGLSATDGLASMLQDFAKTGGAPGQQDWLSAQEFTKNQFAPQEMMLNQAFEDEQVRAKQLAASLGRTVNDPYIQAQLGKERMRSMNMLGAEKSAFMGANARDNAMARLGFTSQFADVKNSLASQAMANRQALLSLGQGVQQSERNWRLNTGTRWGTQTSESGGGLGGALAGGLAGAGMGMGVANGLQKFNYNQAQIDAGGTPQFGGSPAVQIQAPVAATAASTRQSRMSIPPYLNKTGPAYQAPQPNLNFNIWGR